MRDYARMIGMNGCLGEGPLHDAVARHCKRGLSIEDKAGAPRIWDKVYVWVTACVF